MLGALSEYVRNIAVFLLFISFVGIITPNNKYKGYINLVLGFMLIFVLLAPISNVVASSYVTFDDIFTDIETEINANINVSVDNALNQQEFYESTQRALIVDTFERDLIKQIDGMVKEQGFNPTNVIVDINDNEENFGEIKSIHIHMAEENNESTSTAIIQIERISINTRNGVNTVEDSQTKNNEEIKKLKNYISDFYNLSVSNIHITLQENISK